MPETTQTFSNHARFHPPFHFFLIPVLLIHLIWTIVVLVRNPSLPTAESVLLALGLVVMGFLVRVNALKAQDRVIRLEERLRYYRLLSADLAPKAGDLPVNQIVALRFACDTELESLARQALDGKFAKTGDIKKAIKTWRGDYYRV